MSQRIEEPLSLSETTLFAEAISGRKTPLVSLAAGIFLVSLCLQLCVQPQTYTASVSLEVQDAPASTLAQLTGQTSGKKHLGIAQSRQIAESVERSIHLQQFYHLPTFRRAVERVMESTQVNDRANEGMLVIQVSLPGPPLIAQRSAARARAAQQITARAANAYIEALQAFFLTRDNARDTVLLRAAEEQSSLAREQFDTAVSRLEQALKSLPHIQPASGSGANASSSALRLPPLYESLAATETELSAAEAAQLTRNRMTLTQLGALDRLPSEDPLLPQRRGEVARAAAAVEDLRVLFGPEHPRVVVAEEKLKLARLRLAQQGQGVRQALTTGQIAEKARIDSLIAKRDALRQQLRLEESRLPMQRAADLHLKTLQDELAIAVEARKATAMESAHLHMSAVSAQSKLSVLDTALTPEAGTPGVARALLLSTLASLALCGGWIFARYIRLSRRFTSDQAVTHVQEARIAA